jgi:hypothetical protein
LHAHSGDESIVWIESCNIYIQSGPHKCIHSLLINIFGINLNEINISGGESNWFQNSRTSLISIFLLYKYSSYGYIILYFVSKSVYIFLGHPVYSIDYSSFWEAGEGIAGNFIKSRMFITECTTAYQLSQFHSHMNLLKAL